MYPTLYHRAEPKPTMHNGTRYRSKLEAQWAALFDLLGLDYEYEAVQYTRPDGEVYRPDFRVRLSDGRFHLIEIKPGSRPGARVDKQLRWLRELSRRPDIARASILFGEPNKTAKRATNVRSFENGELIRPEIWASLRQTSEPSPVIREPLDPGAMPLSWQGPFPWHWITQARQCAGKNGVIAGLQLWHSNNVGGVELTGAAAELEGVHASEVRRVLCAMEKAGLLTRTRRPGSHSILELCQPMPSVWNIRGPLPIDWVRRAAALGRNPLLVGLALWRIVGAEGSATVPFKNGRSLVVPQLMSAEAKTQAQRQLAKAGLISVKTRGGHASLVTILVGGAQEEPGK